MPKRMHHFVPKLYLKAFCSAPKRIHVYNLTHGRAIKDASLRDQCRAHRLYGDTDDVEDTLAVFESHTAPVLQEIVRHSHLPPVRTLEHMLLKFFVALQLTRTPLRAGRLNAMSDKLSAQVRGSYPTITDTQLDSIRFGPEDPDPIFLSLSTAAEIAVSISDLELHLVCAPQEHSFITSDNPTTKYNQYHEGLQGMGITGPLWRGIQIFLPLSPNRLLLLYDKSVYKVGKKGSDASLSVTQRDVENLNLLQVVNTERNLYFNDWRIEQEVKRLSSQGSNHREADPVVVEELVQDDEEETASLFHVYERVPDLSFRLSFMRIRERAQKISRSKRKYHPKYRYRKTPATQQSVIKDSVPHEIRTEIYRRK